MPWEKRIKYVTVHHSGTVFKETDNFQKTVESIRRYDKEKNWGTEKDPAYAPDIVYHTIINPYDGLVWYTSNINNITWHDSENTHSLGVCILGDGRVQDWNINIEHALDKILSKWRLLGLKKENFRAHREVKATECPGNLYYNGFLKWKHSKDI